MKEKIAVITGATSGIGKETAKALAFEGMKLVLPVRNMAKGEALQKELHELTGNGNIALHECDLSSMDSIRAFAGDYNEKYDRLDVLVNNAGVWEMKRSETKDGIEKTFGVNHLAPFLLTNLLLGKLKASAPSRIISVSSMAHIMGKIRFDDLEGKRRWNWMGSYAQSKLANLFFTRELARKLEGTGVVANCLHPGIVATHLFDKMPKFLHGPMRLVMIPPKEGAQTAVFLATAPEALKFSGEYFANKKIRKTSAYTFNPEVAGKLWKVSRQYTGL
ncbi:MAG: SDR family oxidoreductase [Bacteroidales bacterium]|jgi:NAD(P)-dependent dehydrogenase (short-subunit alcohol dehydrogenase family)|nr:SDR family oxidoreductase [Bacteroidales bacterium]NLM92577.1 SDR family oxidoreductase [Bacteroidales bacterium]